VGEPQVERPSLADEPVISQLDDFLPPARGGEEQVPDLPWPTAPREGRDPLGDTDRQHRGRWG
jgi:hypothetical protein